MEKVVLCSEFERKMLKFPPNTLKLTIFGWNTHNRWAILVEIIVIIMIFFSYFSTKKKKQHQQILRVITSTEYTSN